MPYRTRYRRSRAKQNNGTTALLQRSWAKNPRTSRQSNTRQTSEQSGADLPARSVLPGLQAKMTVGEVDSPAEREADQVAERVMSMSNPLSFAGGSSGESGGPAGGSGKIHRKCPACGGAKEEVQRQCATCAGREDGEKLRGKMKSNSIQREAEKDEDTVLGKMQNGVIHREEAQEEEEELPDDNMPGGTIAREAMDDEAEPEEAGEEIAPPEEEGGIVERKAASKASVPTVNTSTASSIRSMQNSGGSPLPRSEMNFFGPRMGATADIARIHTGTQAEKVASDVGARAFTLGSDVFFNKGEYSPGSAGGRKLMAHELAHVGQNQAGGVGVISREIIRREDRDDFNPGDRQETDPNAGGDQVDLIFNERKEEIHVVVTVETNRITVRLRSSNPKLRNLGTGTYRSWLFDPRNLFQTKMARNATALGDLETLIGKEALRPGESKKSIKIKGEKPISNRAEFIEYAKKVFRQRKPNKNNVIGLNAELVLTRDATGQFVPPEEKKKTPETKKPPEVKKPDPKKSPDFPIKDETCIIIDRSHSMWKHRAYLRHKIQEGLKSIPGIQNKKVTIKLLTFSRKVHEIRRPTGNLAQLTTAVNKLIGAGSSSSRPTSEKTDTCVKSAKQKKHTDKFDDEAEVFAWKNFRGKVGGVTKFVNGDGNCKNVILFTDLYECCYKNFLNNKIPTRVENLGPDHKKFPPNGTCNPYEGKR